LKYQYVILWCKVIKPIFSIFLNETSIQPKLTSFSDEGNQNPVHSSMWRAKSVLRCIIRHWLMKNNLASSCSSNKFRPEFTTWSHCVGFPIYAFKILAPYSLYSLLWKKITKHKVQYCCVESIKAVKLQTNAAILCSNNTKNQSICNRF
jgi:hypothetical protein